MQQLTFRAMGSRIEAFVDEDTQRAQTALRRLPRAFARWEQVLSRFRPSSDLNRLNAHAGHGAQRPHPVLREVLDVALRGAQRSNGLVTPTVLAVLEQSGYDRSFDPQTPFAATQPRGSTPTGVAPWQSIVFDRRRATIDLPAGVGLDLGGFGKGWAAQRAARLLRSTGPALVSAGGDIAVSGPMASGAPWCVAIGDPFGTLPYLATLWLRRGGLATSGIDYRRWQVDGRLQHHIIDPRHGRPAATDLLSVSVAADNLLDAETDARALLIAGRAALDTFLTAGRAPALLAVTVDGDVVISPAMYRRLISITTPQVTTTIAD